MLLCLWKVKLAGALLLEVSYKGPFRMLLLKLRLVFTKLMQHAHMLDETDYLSRIRVPGGNP